MSKDNCLRAKNSIQWRTWLTGWGQVVFGGEHRGHDRLQEENHRRPVGEVDGPLEAENCILRPREHAQGAQVHQADHKPHQKVRCDQPFVQQVRRYTSYRTGHVPLKFKMWGKIVFRTFEQQKFYVAFKILQTD